MFLISIGNAFSAEHLHAEGFFPFLKASTVAQGRKVRVKRSKWASGFEATLVLSQQNRLGRGRLILSKQHS